MYVMLQSILVCYNSGSNVMSQLSFKHLSYESHFYICLLSNSLPSQSLYAAFC